MSSGCDIQNFQSRVLAIGGVGATTTAFCGLFLISSCVVFVVQDSLKRPRRALIGLSMAAFTLALSLTTFVMAFDIKNHPCLLDLTWTVDAAPFMFIGVFLFALLIVPLQLWVLTSPTPRAIQREAPRATASVDHSPTFRHNDTSNGGEAPYVVMVTNPPPLPSSSQTAAEGAHRDDEWPHGNGDPVGAVAPSAAPAFREQLPPGADNAGTISPPPTLPNPTEPHEAFKDPEGDDWVLDPSGLLWSDQKALFFDRASGHFYDPHSEHWYDPSTEKWYAL
jgi:hypothetical protein